MATVERVRLLVESSRVRDHTRAKDILRGLISNNICARCCFRCLGCQPSRLEQPLPLKDVCEYVYEGEQQSSDVPEYVCSLCYGLLQLDTASGSSFNSFDLRLTKKGKNNVESAPMRVERTSEPDFYDKVMLKAANAIEAEGFACKEIDFTMDIFIPASILLRELALVYWLREHYPGNSFDHIIDLDSHQSVKHLCRRIFVQSFGNSLQSSNVKDITVASGDIGVEIHFETEGPSTTSEEEGINTLTSMARGKGEGGGGKKRKRGQKATFADKSPTALFKAALRMDKEKFLSFATQPGQDAWKVSSAGCLHTFYFRHPIYIAGKYIKKNRALSQTPWHVLGTGERVGDSSVEELIARVFEALASSDEYKMVSAGREDIDVRMLGTGRPFIMEIRNCSKRSLPLHKLKDEGFTYNLLKGEVELGEVYTTNKKALALLKEGAEEKTKTYTAVSWLSKPLTSSDLERVNAQANLIVHQKTPLRVLHRRTGLIRDKVVYSIRMRGVPGNCHFATVDLHTQAGTYIKEFVHGDLGRTHPSIASLLGCDADILQLDVSGVDMDFHAEKVD